jgi:hypothetical protein
MEEKNARFLPFDAINEFMRDDYRMTVVREVLNGMPNLPEEQRLLLEQMTRRVVKVPGFRNSAKAPVALRLRATADAFAKSAPLVAGILLAWGDLHAPLRQKIHDLLKERGWPVFPPEADRTQMPGFMVTWPKGEDFDTLVTAFKEQYPEDESSSDDISLMVVWVSVRLPYQMEDEDEQEGAGAAELNLDEGELPAAAAPAV